MDEFIDFGKYAPGDIEELEKRLGQMVVPASFCGILISNFLPREKYTKSGTETQIKIDTWKRIRPYLLAIKKEFDTGNQVKINFDDTKNNTLHEKS